MVATLSGRDPICQFQAPGAITLNKQLTVNPEFREIFDRLLEEVLASLPEPIADILEDVPLYVEDYPSDGILRQMRIRDRTSLCGLYTGIPLIERTAEVQPVLSDSIHLFREGIVAHTIDVAGRLEQEELKRQIRITILHELGHHHGFDEDELEEMGYG
jgi:predicted Zn-dependent protease with MMP-like domain